jgi:hypothetical protein
MAKIKLKGHDSGTGVLTVTAPNTSTDRVITLPDSTATLATTADVPSSITDNGDATAITIDSSERVGIGTGSPLTNSLLHIQSNASSGVSAINNGLLLVENNTGVGIGLLSNNDRQQTIAFGDPEDNDVGFINYGHDTNQMSFNVNAAERMRITANGVTFNGDTAAANALSDYEEGSHNSVWTTGNSGSITMNRVAMGYVKVGKLVTVTGEIDVTAVSSPIGGVRVTLPFTIASHTAGRNMSFVTKPGMYHVPHHQDNAPCFIGHAGSSHFEGIYEQDNGAFADWNPQAGEAVYFSFSYFTDS